MEGMYIAAGLFVLSAAVWYAVHNYKKLLQSKIDLGDLAVYQSYASVIVEAVEQISGTRQMSNEEKLDYAMDLFLEKFPSANPAIVRMMIEAAVKLMNESYVTIFTEDDPGVGMLPL